MKLTRIKYDDDTPYPFTGKYYGKPLSEVSNGYLRWAEKTFKPTSERKSALLRYIRDNWDSIKQQ